MPASSLATMADRRSALSIARTSRADATAAKLLTRDGARQLGDCHRTPGSRPTSIDVPPSVHWVFICTWVCGGTQYAGGGAKNLIMKPLLIAIAVVLVAGSGLAIMNKACKSGYHAWCSQISSIRHHVKHG
jgi:hypothetical protein